MQRLYSIFFPSHCTSMKNIFAGVIAAVIANEKALLTRSKSSALACACFVDILFWSRGARASGRPSSASRRRHPHDDGLGETPSPATVTVALPETMPESKPPFHRTTRTQNKCLAAGQHRSSALDIRAGCHDFCHKKSSWRGAIALAICPVH